MGNEEALAMLLGPSEKRFSAHPLSCKGGRNPASRDHGEVFETKEEKKSPSAGKKLLFTVRPAPLRRGTFRSSFAIFSRRLKLCRNGTRKRREFTAKEKLQKGGEGESLSFQGNSPKKKKKEGKGEDGTGDKKRATPFRKGARC